MSNNVFVAGGTGTAGRAYTQALLDAGFNVKVTVKPGSDAKGLLSKQAVPYEVDLRNEEDVIHAVKGSDYVFISLLGRGDKMAEDEEKITRNVVHAAKLARVKRIVYTSVYLADQKTGVAHFEIKGTLEEAIRASGIPHTILRPTTFMDAFNTPWIRGGIEEKGVLASPISVDAVISYVYTGDLARIAVSTLNKPEYDGAIVELGGPEALTYKKILATINELAGRQIAYYQIPIDQLQQQTDPTIVDMVRYFNEHGFSIEHHPAAFENVKLTTVREFLEQAGWKQLKVKGESDQ